ncbi:MULTISPECIES: FMN-binding negative transcriptional regulator [unclassified Caulobacter]|uniref:FMN-binding negative transcriptional regulator n=1 Tax=unclassified Caulobacter TaxID=2648921 RepID=UPI000D35A280|nr:MULTISPECIES: FMN-binding negative transcriptional regulator [unclassified Caulobacter]PTS91871.1 transcriptional regulator [Caulobacter sp. HMWF009]PTT06861.1 transcriptional regulator [Caulobacter sp. HMWF025]
MHPAPAFRVDDRETLLAFLAAHPFVTLAAGIGGRPFVAQAPVVVREIQGELAIDFHLSRGNALAPHLVQGFRAVLLATGLDAYVSPDWYESADQVPTWNYLSVEAEGAVAVLDEAELVAQLDDLSRQEEARLAPKPLWTRDKMAPGKFDAMLRGIIGGRLFVERLEGTFKLSQNKTPADRLGAAEGLGEHPLAGLMRAV